MVVEHDSLHVFSMNLDPCTVCCNRSLYMHMVSVENSKRIKEIGFNKIFFLIYMLYITVYGNHILLSIILIDNF